MIQFDAIFQMGWNRQLDFWMLQKPPKKATEKPPVFDNQKNHTEKHISEATENRSSPLMEISEHLLVGIFHPWKHTGIIKSPIWGDQTMQIYGQFEGFHLFLVHCLGWWYNVPWHTVGKPSFSRDIMFGHTFGRSKRCIESSQGEFWILDSGDFGFSPQVFSVWNVASTTAISTLKYGFSSCRVNDGGPRGWARWKPYDFLGWVMNDLFANDILPIRSLSKGNLSSNVALEKMKTYT